MPLPIRTQILNAVESIVNTLALPEIQSVTIRTKRPVQAAQSMMPGLEIWRLEPDQDPWACAGGDFIAYQIPMVFKAKDPADVQGQFLLGDVWHQNLARTFMDVNTIRAIVPEVLWQEVAGPSNPPGGIEEQGYVFGGLMITVHAYEPRGLGA